MQAFLMSQGLWGYAEGTIDEPLYLTPVDKDGKPEKVSDKEKAKYNELPAPWKCSQDMAQGSIMLRLTPSIQQNLAYLTTAESLWDALKDAYDITNIPTVYKDFKEIFSFWINPNQHPAPQFNCLSVALGRLKSTRIKGRSEVLTLHDTLQGLVALAALPNKWEHLVPIVITTNDIEDVTLAEVRSSVIAQYETETNKGQHKSASSHATANKLSAVKWKHGNPHFAQQDCSQTQAGPSTSNQQQHRQRGSRGSRCGGKDKGKGKKRNGHSHVASVAFAAPVFTTDAALPPPSSSTIAHFGASSSMVTQTVHQLPPAMRTKGIYPSVNKAISLLERMCHGSVRDACLQGQPRVASPSKARTKNIGREECQESRRKHVDRLDDSGQGYQRIGRTHQITCRLEISVLITGLDMMADKCHWTCISYRTHYVPPEIWLASLIG